jgi:pimeloyl-ACP methyl ester carboxylesterase
LLPDRRGSGVNTAERGDAPRRGNFLDDLDDLSDWCRRELGTEQLDVVGVSWGGRLAAQWARRRPERVRRLLFIAPGIFPAVDVSLWTKLRIVAALLLAPRTRFEIPLSDPALFTQHQPAKQFIASDPDKLTHATARFLFASNRAERAARRLPRRSLSVPVTVFLATNDRIIRNGPTERWAERISRSPATIEYFPSASHSIEFEPDVTTFRACLFAWARD